MICGEHYNRRLGCACVLSGVLDQRVPRVWPVAEAAGGHGPGARHPGRLFPLLSAQFLLFDDPQYVTENPRVLAGLTWDNVRWAFGAPHFGFYHPLTWLSHMADVAWSGLHPGGHHLVSLLIHMGGTFLLLAALYKATGAFWRSYAATALFALHPMHVESVAWIAERKDVLCGFFFLAALLAYVFYCQRPSASRYAGTLVLFLCSLMSKSMSVTFPILLLLLDFWPLRRYGNTVSTDSCPNRTSFRRLLIEKAPFFLASLIAGALTLEAQRDLKSVVSLQALPLRTRGLVALAGFAEYLGKLLVPVGLAPFYPVKFRFLAAFATLGALLLVLVVALAWRWRRIRPHFLVGWGWFLIGIAPVCGLVQTGGQRIADRYTYLPSVGLFLSVSWGLGAFARDSRARTAIASALAVVVFVLYGGLSFRQATYWHDTVSLFTHTLEIGEESDKAHSLLGEALLERGENDAGFQHLQRAVAINPYNIKALGAIGYHLVKIGRLQEAEACFELLVRRFPTNALGYFNLGYVKMEMGHPREALGPLERAIVLDPGLLRARVQAARALLATGQAIEAEREVRIAILLWPNESDLYSELGKIFREEKEAERARTGFEKAHAMGKTLPAPPEAKGVR